LAQRPAVSSLDMKELIQICMGTGMVRDENGINMVTCHYCEGEGRAPAPD
jgi:hypothetical protein